jgi:hypothetical protein
MTPTDHFLLDIAKEISSIPKQPPVSAFELEERMAAVKRFIAEKDMEALKVSLVRLGAALARYSVVTFPKEEVKKVDDV